MLQYKFGNSMKINGLTAVFAGSERGKDAS